MGKVLASANQVAALEREAARLSQEIQDDEQRLRDKRQELRGLERALSVLGRGSDPVRSRSAEPPALGGRLRKGQAWLARRGRPAKVSEILRGVGVKPTPEAVESFSSQLRRNAKRGRGFRKVGPNEYEAIPG